MTGKGFPQTPHGTRFLPPDTNYTLGCLRVILDLF